MENRHFKQFNFFLLLSFLFFGLFFRGECFAKIRRTDLIAKLAKLEEPVLSGQSSQASKITPSIAVELSQERVKDGAVVFVKITTPGISVKKIFGKFLDKDVPAFVLEKSGESQVGQYGMVFGVPYLLPPGRKKVDVVIEDGSGKPQTLTRFIHVVPGKYRSEKLKVEPRQVSPTPEDMQRIEKENQIVASVYQKLTLEKMWSDKFILPVESAVTSEFGTKRVFNGEMKSFHKGVDLRAPEGTPIHAPAAGRIAMAKDLFFTGNTILIDHGYGIVTLYAHLSELKVKEGDLVKPDSVLGLSGQTGRAAGPHLHWGAIIQNVKVNPLDLIKVVQ